MENFKLNHHDNGLYRMEYDEFGRGAWMRVATYPPGLQDLDEVLEWCRETTDDDE